MRRPWQAGMSFRTGDGLEWRVSQGAKTPGDLVLEVRTRAGWSRIKMQTGFLMADFLWDNETRLRDEGYFPPSAEGGDYYLRHLRIAATDGWEVASGRLDGERAARRSREQMPAPRLIAPCPSIAADFGFMCALVAGHGGPHHSSDDELIWPQLEVAS